MEITDERLDAAIREALDEPRTTPDDHPEPDVLLAYHEETLSEREAEAVREHLAVCLECSQVILDFAAFPDLEPATEAHRATPAGMGRDWRELQRRTAGGRSPWWRSHEYVGLPAAALFLVAVLGLGVWAWQLREGNADLRERNEGLQEVVADLERASGDVPLLTLLPASDLDRGGEVPIVPRTGSHWAVFVLVSTEGIEGHDRYTLDVRGSDGEILLADLPLTRRPDHSFVVSLPTHLLEAGARTIQVYGEGPGGRELIDEYPVLYDPESDPGWIDGADLEPDRAEP